MAITRIENFTINLGEIIKTRLDSFVKTMKNIRAGEEADFQRRVLEEGLSYQSQLNYRGKQLIEEQRKSFPDLDFIQEVKNEISNLKKFIRYEKIRNDYKENYTRYAEGKMTIENLISFLGGQLDNETDPTLRDELSKELSVARVNKVTEEKNVIENRYTLAQNDKSIELIDKVISEIEEKRSEGLRLGNMELVTAMDVKLSVLNNRRQEIETENKIHDFEVGAIRNVYTSSQKLDFLNNLIANANQTNRITIDNKDWNSEYEYFSVLRNQYIAGSGTGEFKDFFSDLTTEINNKVKSLSSSNKWGNVPLSTIESIDKDFKSLAQRTEFQPFINLIEANRVKVLDDTLKLTTGAIIDESEFYGDYQKGYQALSAIQSRLGMDLSSYIGKLYYTEITSMPAKATALRNTAQVKVESITGEAFDELNPKHQKLYEQEISKLLIPPVEPGKVFEEVPEKPPVEKPLAEKPTIPEIPAAKAPEVPKVEEKPVVPTVTPPTAPKMVEVKKGETLSAIALRELGSAARWQELKTPEGTGFTLETAKGLQIGQKLIIPTK